MYKLVRSDNCNGWSFFCVLCTGHREYHVQFFGSVAERAWIHEKRIVIYQGKQQFEELQAETLRKATNPVEKQKVRTSRNSQHLCLQALKEKEILEDNLIQSARELQPERRFRFQQELIKATE